MATDTPGAAPETLEASEPGGKRKWTLQLFPDGLRGEREDDATSFHLLRANLLGSVKVLDELLLKRTLIVKKPRRTTLQLDPPGFQTLSRWIGESTLLRLALKRRLSWTLPIGILYVITSLPLPGDVDAGVDPSPFNPVWAFLGAVLLVQGLASRKWALPVFFLLDALWFIGLAADTAYGVVQGGSRYWLIVVVLQIALAVSGLQLWRRFRGATVGARRGG